MTPFDDFMFLINSILLGEEPVSLWQYYNNWVITNWRLFFPDHRRLYTLGWHICGICGVCAMVLLSDCSKGTWNTSWTVREPIHTIQKSRWHWYWLKWLKNEVWTNFTPLHVSIIWKTFYVFKHFNALKQSFPHIVLVPFCPICLCVLGLVRNTNLKLFHV